MRENIVRLALLRNRNFPRSRFSHKMCLLPQFEGIAKIQRKVILWRRCSVFSVFLPNWAEIRCKSWRSIFWFTLNSRPGFRTCTPEDRSDTATSLSTNHGGICIFVRPGVQVRVVDLPIYKSVELLSVRSGALSFVFIVICRPDPASTLTVNESSSSTSPTYSSARRRSRAVNWLVT